MSRTSRLLDLIQSLRRHRRPVSGRVLADELGVSLRTVYRDIAMLQAQGAQIEGEAGVGYVLRPGFLLPPLMFTEDEIEALALGTRWVADRADPRLGMAAQNALARIAAVLPADLRDRFEASALLVGPGPRVITDSIDVAALRQALRAERKLLIAYRDAAGQATERMVWPCALGFFEQVRVLVAWCELRNDFRHFRTDRIIRMTVTDIRPPRRRQALLKDWRKAECDC